MHAISVVLKVTYYICPTEGIARAITFLQHTSHGMSLFTGRNEVVAKVMFLHVSVILSTGGGLQAGRTPPGQGDPPQTKENPPPWTRENPPSLDQREPPPPDQGDLPPTRQTPPDWAEPPQTRQTPPPGKQTPEYGLRAAGTHPTGMHSCLA